MPRPNPLAIREDATVKSLRESTGVVEAATNAATPTRRNIQIITPGWGSSGYYSAEVLEAAAAAKVIPAGTKMFLNHASESERHDRPERDVEKIAAVLVEDATWDGTRLLAPADLMGPHAELIESLAPYIGVSISGSATDITIGEAEGRTGPIIEGLAHVASVDFVTQAGRGGMVLLESASPSMVNARAVGHGVAEATVNDTREALQTALRDAYGADKTYVWVRDFDDTTVWFEIESESDAGVYGESYTQTDNGAVVLTGDRTEVRVSTTYVPVARPDSNTTTESQKENSMGKIQVEESVHTDALAKAGRVDAVESENTTLKTENATLKESIAHTARTDRAKTLIGESEHVFTPLEARALLVDLPVVEADGVQVLDETAFAERLVEASKESAAALGATLTPGVRGFGPSASTDTPVAESGPTTSPWGRPLTEQKGA
jgi:hypothetical protein